MWWHVRCRVLAFLVLAFLAPLLGASASSAGVPVDALVYVSSTSAGSVPSGPGSAGPTIAFGNEDVLVYDSVADTWAIAFDGSAAGVASANVDGFSIASSGDFLISFAGPASVPGVTGTVDDSDVVTWDGTSFALLIDGSDVGLTSGGEDIDAIATAGPSSYVFSTLGSAGVPKTGGGNLAARDEDLIELTTSSTGAVTAGNFVLDFDGSDVGLGGEDIVGAHTDADTGVVYASVLGGFNVGFAGDGDDIVAFTGATGEATSGTFALFFNGDDHDFGREQIDAVHIEFQAGPPQGEADLSVTKTDDADPVVVGDTISYTVTVANAGPDTAVNVVAAETLPAGVTFVSTSGCTQDPSGQTSCSLGNIDAGASAAYTIDVTVDPGTSGTITNTVTVTSDSVDPNPSDNSTTEDTDIAGVPVAVDDGPATSSTPGNPYHVAADTPLVVGNGDVEDLLNNDSLGDPAATIASFGGGDVGGSVTDNSAGNTAGFGTGSLAVNDDGSFDFIPDTGFTGIFTFEYRLENPGGSSDAIVSIFVGERPTAGGADLVYLSMTSIGTIDALTYSREDIIVYDTGTNTWDVAFDGSDVGLAGANIDAFTIVENDDVDEILFSLSAPTVIPGISPRVDDSDIVRFLGSGGVNTTGTLELFIDGSDVSLRSGGEDVDALAALGGNLVMSTLGGFNVPATGGGALVGADEDLIEFAPTGTGPVTTGSFTMAFDGSDVALQQEDLTGAAINPDNGSVFATSLNGFNVPGLTGDSNDIFVFTPGTTGPNTSGTFSLFFDLDTTSLTGTSKSVDALHIEQRDAPAENQPPDAVDDVNGFNISEDAVLTVPDPGVLFNDTDPDLDPLTVTDFDATSAKGATVVVNPDGSFSYDPTAAPILQALGDETTTEDTFTYTIDDGNSGTDTATVTVVVEGRNDEPDAIDDEYGTDAITVLTVPISGVLSNDADVEGATLEALLINGTSGRGADLVLNADGSFTYDPNGVSDFADLAAGETLTDTFSYTMTDGAGGFDSATVTITVTGVNDDPVADDDSYVADEDTVLDITAPGLLINDEDPDTTDTLTVQSHDPTSDQGATVVVNPDGSFTYDPTGVAALQAIGDGDEQDDTFDYIISDGNGGTDTATVTITVSGVNDDPVAVDDGGGETDEDTILNVPAPGVLDNDTDPDGDTLTVDVFASDSTSVEGATIALNADGSFSYDPTAAPDLQALAGDQSVNDSFTYTVTDGNGGTDTATVTIFVLGRPDLTAPVANDDADATDEDTAIAVIAVIASPTQGLLANDSDPNGDPLMVSASDATSAEGATVTVSPDGGYTYNPIGAAALQGLALDQTVQDTFEYTVSDGNGGTDTATVTIAVTGLNDDPVAVDDIDDADQDFLLTVVAPGVLDNDTDADGDPLTVSTSDTASAEGAIVSVSSDGSFTYDPRTAPSLLALDGNTCVDDTFTYTVSDSNGGTDTATVTVNVCGVGDDPDAVDDFDATDEDTAIAVIASPTQGLLVNDTDPENDPLTVSAFDATSTQGATVTVSPDGGYTYDPSSSTALQALAVGVTVDDTFTYEVDDGTSRTDTATVTITVTGVNDAPVAVDDDYSTDEDTALGIAAPGVLGNDTDVEGDSLTVSAFDATSTEGATVTVNSDGSFTYDPTGATDLQDLDDGESVDDTFTYTVSDSNGGTDTATVTITVAGVDDNQPPDAVDDDYSTDEDSMLTISAEAAGSTAFGGSGPALGQFNRPYDVAVDGAGNIVVADRNNQRVQVCDTAGVCTAFGRLGSGFGEFSFPEGVAVDGAGNIVVADSANHRIQVCDTAGVCTAFGSFGSGLGKFKFPSGVVVDGAGNIVVADNQNHRVQVCDPATGVCTAFGSRGSGLGEFNRPLGVVVDGAGNIVVADSDNHRVQVCDPATGVCTAFGSFGSGLGQFSFPLGVVVDGAGNIVVADNQNHRVQVCDTAGVCTAFGSNGSGPGQLSFPLGVAVDGAGNIVVADTSNDRIQIVSLLDGLLVNDTDPENDPLTVSSAGALTSTEGAAVTVNSDGSFTYDPTGGAAIQALNDGESVDDTFDYTISDGNGGTDTATVTITVAGVDDNQPPDAVDDDYSTNEDSVLTVSAQTAGSTAFGSFGTGLGEFNSPRGVAVDGAGNIVVVDTENHRVQVCDTGGACTAFGGEGSGLGEFKTPQGVAVDGAGNIVVADTINDRVQVCTTGGVCTAFGSRGSGSGEFDTPFGVVVDGSGNIIVADFNNHRIQVCTTGGVCTAFGSFGSGPGQFSSPSDVAVDGSGNIIVADLDNHRVQVCTTGGVCTAFGSFGAGLGEFSFPRGVAVDGGGNIVVADDRNHRIQVCDAVGVCAAFGINGSGFGEFDFPSGVAVDGAGNIVVADSGNDRVQIVSLLDGLLVNDTDPDNDPLTVTVLGTDTTSAEGASVSVNSDGSFSYDPTGVASIQALNDGDSVDDTFDYSISDGNGGTDTATVRITVAGVDDNQPPDAVDDDYSIDEDSVLTVSAQAGATGFGSSGSGLGEFSGPRGVAVDGAGNIVVSDTNNNRMQVCTTSGVCTAFGSFGSGLGEFNLPRGVAVDGPGNIVVADTVNDRVQVCTTTGVCTAFGSTGSGLGEFAGPRGVAVDGPGNIVVADTNNDRVQVCTSVGVCTAFGSNGSGLGEFAGPRGVAVDAAGNIIVADFGNDRIQVCDTGGVCTAFGSTGSGLGEFAGLRGVAVDASGDIVVADTNNDRVQVCTAAGVCTALGGFGVGVGEFQGPRAVAVDGAGNIVVADTDNHRVQIGSFVDGLLVNDTDPDNDPLTVSASDTTSAEGAAVTVNADGSFTYDPTGVTSIQDLDDGESVDDTFDYTVSDSSGGTDTTTVTITVAGVDDNQPPDAVADGYSTDKDSVLASGQVSGVTAFGSNGSSLGQFNFPSGVAVDGAGNIVVADTGNHRVQVCTSVGVCTAFGSNGVSPGQFVSPHGVAVDGSGNIVVADTNSSRVQVCTSVGVCTAFGSNGVSPGQFVSPHGVAVDGSGNIVVADTGNHRVQVCTTAGVCTAFGSNGVSPGQFISPHGVAVDGDGNIVVADTGNHRVQVCTTGGVCSAFGSNGSGPGQFLSPRGVAVDGSGNIVVSDSNSHRVQVCTTVGVCTAFGSQGAGLGEFNAPHGVAVDGDGNVVVADRSNHRIQIVSLVDGLLVNDTDPDNDPLTVTVLGTDTTSAEGAAVTVNSDGSFTYDPTGVAAFQALAAGATLDDTFTYTISDGQGDTDVGTVTVTVVGTA